MIINMLLEWHYDVSESEKYLIDHYEEVDLKSGHSWVIFSIK